MSSAHYRDLWRQLSAAQADRLQALQELAEFDTEQTRLLPQHLQEALRAVDWEHQQARSELDSQHAQRMQSIEEQYRGDDSLAKTEYGRVSSEVDLKYEADVAAAAQKYNDSCWMVQSILDETSENSPKVQHERLKSQLQQARVRLTEVNQEIRTLSEQAANLVAARWQRAGETPKPNALPRSRDELEQLLTTGSEATRQGFAKLRGQLIPSLFGSWLALLPFILVVAGGIFALLFLVVQPDWIGQKFSPNEWAAISGGAAFAVCLIALLVLWNIAAKQTAGVFEQLQQSAIDVQAGFQRWQKIADEELKRADLAYRKRFEAMSKRRDESLAQYAAEHEARNAELETERRQALNAATQKRDADVRAATEQYQSQRKAEEAAYQTSVKSLEAGWQAKRKELTHAHDQQITERDKHRRQLLNRCETSWNAALTNLRSEVDELKEESDRQFPTWADINSPEWTPPEQIPSALRLGDYRFHVESPRPDLTPEQRKWIEVPDFNLPAVVPFPDSPSLVVKAAGSGRTDAVSILQVGMLRYLAQLPPGDIRFTVIDPVGLGENFAAFMHLADYDDLLITNRIWTESGQIEEQLAKLTEHMENVFQKYLRNEFESLEEYNSHAGEVAEPYRVLIVADFPNGFTERAAQRLVSIASSGARCGVHTMVSVDTQQAMPRDFDLSRLEESATVIEWKPAREQPGKFLNPVLGPVAPLVPDDVPSANLMASLIKKVGELSKDVRRVEVPFVRIAPREEEYWTGDSRKGIEVPLGRAGATKLQYMKLGQGTSQHVLIAGKTGSGKSTLLHVMITDLALRYSPDEVEFYLIDFKKGVEFKTYASNGLPHARVIAIESDREFGTSVLEKLDAVLKERGDLFRDAGAQDVKSFREARPDIPMPRILLMVDEFQEFFIEDDKYSQTAALLIDRLVRQGRAFGMHVLLGSQSLGGAYSLPRTTIGQMAVRIALQCSEADAHMILSENNSAARLLTRPGEAIYNNANGMMEGNNPFQVAWLNDDQRDELLSRLDRLADKRQRPWPIPIVFEGNLPANPALNKSYCALLEAAEAPTPTVAPVAWLGDSVAMAGPAEIQFFKRSGTNLLLVGQEAQSAFGIMTNCLAALVAQPVGRIELFTEASGGVHQGAWSTFLRAVPESRLHCAETGTTDGIIGEFAAEVTRRQQEPGAALPWFLVIDDLSRYRELRKSDDDFGFGFDKNKKQSPGQSFSTILKEGPAVGVHLIVWVDSYNNVDRWFSRQMLREFEMRAVFQMSAADSSNLIDSPAASRLGNNRALLYSDERGTLEKFRPYGPPSEDWLAFLRGVLANASPPNGAMPIVPDNGHAEEAPKPLLATGFDRLTKSPPASAAPVVPPDSTPAPAPAPPTAAPAAAPPVPLEAPSPDMEVADDLSAWSVQ